MLCHGEFDDAAKFDLHLRQNGTVPIIRVDDDVNEHARRTGQCRRHQILEATISRSHVKASRRRDEAPRLQKGIAVRANDCRAQNVANGERMWPLGRFVEAVFMELD